MVTLVIGHETAERIGQSPREALTVVRSRPRGHAMRGRRLHGSMDAYVEPLARSGASAVVLAGEDDGELRRAARALGRDVLRLPPDRTSAAWVVSVGAALVRADRPALVRVLQVLCNGRLRRPARIEHGMTAWCPRFGRPPSRAGRPGAGRNADGAGAEGCRVHCVACAGRSSATALSR